MTIQRPILRVTCVSLIVAGLFLVSGVFVFGQIYSSLRRAWDSSPPAQAEDDIIAEGEEIDEGDERMIRGEDGSLQTEREYYRDYIDKRDQNPDSSLYRDGLHLKLPISGARVKVLKDNPCDCDGFIAFDFLGYLPEVNSYLVELNPWEGEGYILVSRQTGASTFIPALPIISPDGRRILVASNCEEGECYHGNSVTILFNVNGELIEECYSKLNWLPSNPVWLDNQAIRLDRTEADIGGSAMAGSRAENVTLVRRSGIWGPPCKPRTIREERERREEVEESEDEE